MKKPRVIFPVLLGIFVMVVLAAPVSGGLAVTDGNKITSPYGISSPVITVTDSDIPANSTITIDVTYLYLFVNSGLFNDANVVVSSNSDAATWTGAVSAAGDVITLTSAGSNTNVGENITVTFTGAGGNRWVTDTYGDQSTGLTVTRTDTVETASINFRIETLTPSPGGLTTTDGEKITSPDGISSPVITIIDSDIPENGTIVIDVPYLWMYVESGTFTNANVAVNDTAATATWTSNVTTVPGMDYSDYITLKSTNGPTVVGENITVTFTGADGNPWVLNSYGYQSMPVTVTRTDTAQTAPINFNIETVPHPPTGLIITDGVKITDTTGNTSPVISLVETDILMDGTITIDISSLHGFVAEGNLTESNIIINDTAVAANWTGTVAGNTLILTSTGGNTRVGENITVTFTGAAGHSWISNTYGNQTTILIATRTDGFGESTFTFMIEIVPPLPKGLTSIDGAKITSTTGSTSPVISIAEADIHMDGTITLDVSGINRYVVGGVLTDSNIVINDNAASANWTGTVAGNILTLTSTGGNTSVGEKVSVTFMGAGRNAWIANTHGNQTVLLTASRTDGLGDSTFNFMIETTPPPGNAVETNFTVSKTADIAPLAVTFTDLSLGNATSWFWEFGDGATSTLQNPDHTYVNVGSYTVNLTATNDFGPDTKTQTDYIHILNGVIREMNTSVDGLTVTNCGGPQTITVDTTVLQTALIPNSSVLEINPPADRGFKSIIIYALNDDGFSQNGNLITGYPTGVYFVTEELAPPSGFSSDTGTNASFNFSIDFPSYPCNALLSTKIWEGVIPAYDNNFRRIADGNNASVVGTAYTATINKTNLPPGSNVRVRMSVDPNWNTYPHLPGGPGLIFIWRISDNEKQGQILPTKHLSFNPVNNLDYYEADSPNGLSTFGLSSLTGNNNPFQMITLILSEIISPPENLPSSDSSNTYVPGAVGTQNTTSSVTTLSVPQDHGKTAKIYSNAKGVVTQATALQSTDGFATVNINTGVVAIDAEGKPLSSITIKALSSENLPNASPGASYSFAGRAYELLPDGATFSPEISIIFTAPSVQFGQEIVVKTFDHVSGTWQDIPGIINPETGTITAHVSHFCCIALFAETVTPESTPASTPVSSPPKANAPAPTAMSTFVGMILWISDLIQRNILIFVGIIIIAVALFLHGRKRRRDRLVYLF